MKKIARISVVALLVMCMTLLSVSTVFASRKDYYTPATWSDPTLTSNIKNETYSSEILDQWQFPGSETLSSGMFFPVGFHDELQFGGKGIQVSGLTGGNTVEVCFAFPSSINSWTGKIYEWNGSKWVSITSTLTPATSDVPGATVCSPKVGNGTYSLLVYYYGTPEPRATRDVR